MNVDETTAEPKPYERVADSLKRRISAGEWRRGALLPGRRDLAVHYGVAGSTLERAIAVLSAEGLLSISDRRGTFVAESLPETFSRSPETVPHTGRELRALVATVGIVAEVRAYPNPQDYDSQWSLQILQGCEHRLAGEAGLSTRFLSTHNTGDSIIPREEAVQQLLDNGAAAVIVIGECPVPTFVTRFAGSLAPIVFAEYVLQEQPFPQVYADDVAAGALAARHLLERGYRRLLYFQPFIVDWGAERLAGIKSVLVDPDDPEALRVLPAEAEPLAGHERDQRILALRGAREALDAAGTPGLGVIAPNDSTAVGFIEAARERGLEPGRDYGIVGFDDRKREAGLTSLRPPLTELGEEAAGLVIRLLRGESAPVRIALSHRLIARGSTTPWREKA